MLIIAGLAYWALTTISAAFGLPPQVTAVIQVLLVIVLVIVLIGLLTPAARHALG